MRTDEQLYVQDSCSVIHIGNNEPRSRLELWAGGEEVFRVTKDGGIMRQGKRINDDDAALADCLRAWIKQVTGMDVRRGAGGTK